MGDLKTLTKARLELEELYSGIPDDSVNLTFQDLAEVQQKASKSPDKKKPTSIDQPIQQEARTPTKGSPLAKLPSLDFNRALQESRHHSHHPLHHVSGDSTTVDSHIGHHHYHDHRDEVLAHASRARHSHAVSPRNTHRGAEERSTGYDDMSVMSMASGYPERGHRRRPGIPHSNICTVCSTYIYIFRHRCLVCGRVYCRECVSIGMGEMTEGRKCVQCLGRRFSQRYIQRAGKVGCCWRYPSAVKLAELKWAEKGPWTSSENVYGGSVLMSRSRSPVSPRTPTRAHPYSNTSPSFVASSPYSPYTPTHHHLPL